jgi:CheY-like chemotaxis protein
LLNLVVNARDAIPDVGTITIATSNVELDDNYVREHEPTIPGEYVMLSVRDTGSGMDETTKARIFEPFFTTKEPGKGTGLGLASVYGIAKQSNGYVWVYSELGQGTTFKLYFPRVRADAEPINAAPASSAMTKGNETIVLVEDEPTLRNVTAATLRSAGYTVLEANGSDAAVHLAEMHPGPIQLLLTDVVLPHMNGVELSKRLVALRPDLKVIFISGYGGEELARHISVAPDAVLVEKPFSRQTLLTKIHTVLHP